MQNRDLDKKSLKRSWPASLTPWYSPHVESRVSIVRGIRKLMSVTQLFPTSGSHDAYMITWWRRRWWLVQAERSILSCWLENKSLLISSRMNHWPSNDSNPSCVNHFCDTAMMPEVCFYCGNRHEYCYSIAKHFTAYIYSIQSWPQKYFLNCTAIMIPEIHCT